MSRTSRVKNKFVSKKAATTVAAISVIIIFAGALIPLSIVMSGVGWEVGSHIQKVSVAGRAVTIGGGNIYTADFDGYPQAWYDSAKGWLSSGTKYPRVLFEVGGTYMVDGFDKPTNNPVQSYPTSGTVKRTVDGVEYECVYDLLLYHVDLRAVTLASARKYDGGWAYPVWVTDAAIKNDLTGLRGVYFAPTQFDISLTIRFQLDPWNYRDADVIWGGVVDVYVFKTDTQILNPKTFGTGDGAERDSPALVEAYDAVNWVPVSGEKPTGNWVDLAPDTDFSHIVDFTVSGRMKHGADLKVGFLGDVIAMDISDVQIDWDVIVEVLVIHGWIPEQGLEEELPEHNKDQEVHHADFWERLDSFLSGFGGFEGYLAIIGTIVIVFIGFYLGIIILKKLISLRGVRR
ncbi:MAG: hypothetical protein ACTSPL_04025 [Candidatus Odinarchaeia archaeon]